MESIKHLKALIYRDLLIEWRQKYAFNGILLYLISTVFIVYLSFISVNTNTWISLFWIIMLFASVNAVAKSFIMESDGKLLYQYTLASPELIIISKMIYNLLLLLILSGLAWLIFSLFLQNRILNFGYFGLILLLGSSGFAFSFTMISAIASKGRNSATLMTILSFPVILPQLMLLIKLTKSAILGSEIAKGWSDLLSLLAVNIIVLVVSYLLFPYLWRE